ncbi:hypothetical protein SLEP1_g31702 [Rubroshorea leprosula]|uniref:Transmembrane protein 45A n=1 Tax=Rubroshorea leprosula TaxID=152421 RepID=A0AAV5KB70_9ROSI|nr:hypothetical protein SLEP1_g31702 [Rubroshorea leprosula]
MGGSRGHVTSGLAFLALGSWHLFNHIKLHLLHPNSYTCPPWFPTSKIRYIELLLIMLFSSIFISTEIFIGHERHRPLDADGSISTNRLNNLEHSAITISFFVYAAFAILLDKAAPKAQHGWTQFLGALAFAQQLLLFHFHSADHMGVEGHYHLLFQCVIIVSLATTLMGIGMPKSFMISFLRSLSIFFQGVWLIVTGYMLWTPALIPRGCFLHLEQGQKVVRCSSHEMLHRAKSLVNLLFSWLLVAIAVFGVTFYLVLAKLYGKNVEHLRLEKEEVKEETDHVELQEKSKLLGESKIFSMEICTN